MSTEPVRMVFKPENLIVDVLEELSMVGMHKRFRIRDAKSKKAPIRTVLGYALRDLTEDDEQHVIYLWTDEETGETHTLKLDKDFIKAVPTILGAGVTSAVTAKGVLDKIGKPDTDTNRRQFRAAVAYWLEKGVLIVSTPKGYFVATSDAEVESCVSNKERQARANLNRAALLRGMSVSNSLRLFSESTATVSAAA